MLSSCRNESSKWIGSSPEFLQIELGRQNELLKSKLKKRLKMETKRTTQQRTEHILLSMLGHLNVEREREKKIVVLRIKFPNGMVYTWWLRWKTVAPYAYRLLHFYGTYSGNWIRASKVISIYCFVGEWHFACIINQRTLVRHTLIVYIIPVQFTSVLMRTNTKWERKKYKSNRVNFFKSCY